MDDPHAHFIFTLHERATDKRRGAYSRAYHTEYEWNSESSARWSNCHDIFKDTEKFKVKKWQVTYTLVDEDVSSQT